MSAGDLRSRCELSYGETLDGTTTTGLVRLAGKDWIQVSHSWIF